MDLSKSNNNVEYTFIYMDHDGVEQLYTASGEGGYEKARDAAMKSLFEDSKAGHWDGMDSSGCIYPQPGNEAERVANMARIARGVADRVGPEDKPADGKTYAVLTDSKTLSIGNGNTWADSEIEATTSRLEHAMGEDPQVQEVKASNQADVDAFMNDVCNDDEPDVDTMARDMSPEQLNEIARDVEDTVNDAMDKMSEDMNPPKPLFQGGWGSSGGVSNHSDKRTVNYGEVSEVAVERQEKHDRWLADLGIARNPAHVSITKAGYKRGSAVVDLGYDNLDASRTTWDNKPEPAIAASEFASILSNEYREDIIVPVGELRMEDDGKLYIPQYGTVAVEKYGLGKMLSLSKYSGAADEGHYGFDGEPLFPRALSMFLTLDPDLRAKVFNEHMKRHGNMEQSIKLRTRKYDGVRSVFAAVSEGYSTYDADEVALFLAAALEESPFKAEIKYNSETTNFTMDATMHAPSDLTDFSAGDLYEVGYRFKSNDRGGGSINGSAIAFWNECLNMIILSSKTNELIRVIHKGDVAEKMAKVHEGMKSGKAAMNRFAADWGILNRATATDYVNANDIEVHDGQSNAMAMLESLVVDGKVGKDIKRDAAVQYLLQSYNNQGGGDTMQDIVNAITRAAHEHLVDDCARDTLEREAGALVPVLAKQGRVAIA